MTPMSAVEVKTTTGNSATAVEVSNELQLDDTDCQPLFLLHVWLREQSGGRTLPQLVDEIGGMLTAPLLSMLIIPAAYLLMRRQKTQVQHQGDAI